MSQATFRRQAIRESDTGDENLQLHWFLILIDRFATLEA